jgi:hypothetical protein
MATWYRSWWSLRQVVGELDRSNFPAHRDLLVYSRDDLGRQGTVFQGSGSIFLSNQVQLGSES